MSFLTNLFMALIAGMVIAAVIPQFVGLIDDDLGRRLGHTWIDMAMAMLGTPLLVWRASGKPVFRRGAFEGSPPVWKTTLDGDSAAFEDPAGKMSELKSRSFGLAHEPTGVIIDIATADIGREFTRLKDDDEFYHETNSGSTARRLIFDLNRTARLVWPDFARAIIRGNADAKLHDRIDEYTRQSQTPFYERPTVRWFIWLAALGAGAGIPVLITRLAESSAGGGVDVSLMLGVLPL